MWRNYQWIGASPVSGIQKEIICSHQKQKYKTKSLSENVMRLLECHAPIIDKYNQLQCNGIMGSLGRLDYPVFDWKVKKMYMECNRNMGLTN